MAFFSKMYLREELSFYLRFHHLRNRRNTSNWHRNLDSQTSNTIRLISQLRDGGEIHRASLSFFRLLPFIIFVIINTFWRLGCQDTSSHRINWTGIPWSTFSSHCQHWRWRQNPSSEKKTLNRIWRLCANG